MKRSLETAKEMLRRSPNCKWLQNEVKAKSSTLTFISKRIKGKKVFFNAIIKFPLSNV